MRARKGGPVRRRRFPVHWWNFQSVPAWAFGTGMLWKPGGRPLNVKMVLPAPSRSVSRSPPGGRLFSLVDLNGFHLTFYQLV